MTTTMEMITVPGGRVSLSDRRTERTWVAELTPYRIAAHPVTTPGTRLPMVDVSWRDAVRFCNALSQREELTPAYHLNGEAENPAVSWDTAADGYRLPTEAEWEYACRAGTTGPRYGELDEVAWYRGNSSEHLHEAGTRQPNPWGLYDTLGNVWEWCWDLYDPEVYGTYRALRGGGWFDEHWSCRASVRRRSHPTFRVDDVGFRVARSGTGGEGA